MLITLPARSAHWYLADGTPFHDVPNASKPGQMRPATIKDAMKAGAFRSVTSVLDIVNNPGLEIWKREQAVLAALTLPRRAGETEHEFAARAMVDADEQAAQAREMGTRLHLAVSKYLTKGELPLEEDVAPLFDPFVTWAKANIAEVIESETVMVNVRNAYAGTRDIRARLVDGRTAHLDVKSQDVKIDAKGKPKPSFYDSWPLQLAAYANKDGNVGDALISVVMDRTRPGIYTKEWLPDSGKDLAQTYLWPFVALCEAWTYFKGCTPGRDKVA